MKAKQFAQAGWVVWVAGCALAARGQTVDRGVSGTRILVVSADMEYPARADLGEVVREIDDPNTGDRWLLRRDLGHPGGPGRLVLIGSRENEPQQGVRRSTQEDTASVPVIHAGDRLLVEEHTVVVDARLAAVALGAAVSGSELDVRLVIGGNVVRAVALGPGRAALATESETRP